MEDALGLYGVALAGLRPRAAAEPAPPVDWEQWRFAQIVAPARDEAGMSIQDGRARVGLPGVGELRLSRADRTISLHVPTPVPAATVEHPLLVPAAATVAYWQGRASVHAAAVLVDGRVWGLLGDRGAGKSTLAAELLLAGGTLFADDLLILTPDSAFAARRSSTFAAMSRHASPRRCSGRSGGASAGASWPDRPPRGAAGRVDRARIRAGTDAHRTARGAAAAAGAGGSDRPAHRRRGSARVRRAAGHPLPSLAAPRRRRPAHPCRDRERLREQGARRDRRATRRRSRRTS